jgi:hypothetical protein
MSDSRVSMSRNQDRNGDGPNVTTMPSAQGNYRPIVMTVTVRGLSANREEIERAGLTL